MASTHGPKSSLPFLKPQRLNFLAMDSFSSLSAFFRLQSEAGACILSELMSNDLNKRVKETDDNIS